MKDFVLAVSKDIMVFVDEAYYEFVDNPDFESMMGLIRDGHNNVIVARTASKIHGMAALRVDFANTHSDIITDMNRKKTGSLNIAGQHAAFASYQGRAAQEFVKHVTTSL